METGTSAKTNNSNLFINGYLKKISERFNIKLDDAFEIFSIASVLDRPFDDVKSNIIIPGSLDGGIDGIYFEGDNGDYTIHVFQCKNSKSLKQNEIEKFRNDFRDIFTDGNKANKQNINGLQSKIKEYETLVNSGKVMDIKLYFLFNGLKKDPKYADNQNLHTNYHKPGEFEIIDSNDLYTRISSLVKSQNKRKTVNFTFYPKNSNITSSKDNQGLISFSVYEVKAAIFRLHAIELCKLLAEEERINGTIEKAFSENIRWFLGRKNLTNEKIIETLQGDHNVYFPFLNNGITIICDEFKLPYNPQMGKYVLPATNPVIVNGLQTTYLIYQEYLNNPESLTDVFLNVKLYQTDNPELVDMITDATNTQSAISFKDKFSNKQFNTYAKTIFDNKGIGYISKRGEVFTNPKSTSLLKTVHNDLPLLLWYSSFYEEPFLAKHESKIVFKEVYQGSINSKHPLNQLFNGSIDSALYCQMFVAYSIYDIYVNQYKKLEVNSINDTRAEYIEILDSIGKEFLVYTVYKIIEDELDSLSNTSIYNAIDYAGYLLKKEDEFYYADKYSYINSILNARPLNREGEYLLARIGTYREGKELVENINNLKINIDNIKL